MNRFLVLFALVPLLAGAQGDVRTVDTVEQMTNLTLAGSATGDKMTVAVRGLTSYPGGMFSLETTSTNDVEHIWYFPAVAGRFHRLSYWYDGTGGVTNGGTSVSIKSAFNPVINFADSTGLIWTLIGTNASVALVDRDWGDITTTVFGTDWRLDNNVVGTNQITTAFYNYLLTLGGGAGGSGTNLFLNGVLMQPALLTNNTSADAGRVVYYTNGVGDILAYATNLPAGGGGGTGSVVRLNAGSIIPDVSFDTTSFIAFGGSGGSITATVVNASLTTGQINSAFYNLVTNIGQSYTFTNGVTNNGGNVVSADIAAGSNITFATNNGKITIASTASSTSGTNVGNLMQVLGGGMMYLTLGTPYTMTSSSMFGIVTNIIFTDGSSTDMAKFTVSMSNALTSTNYSVVFTPGGSQADGLPLLSIEEDFQGTNELRLMVSYSGNSGAPSAHKLQFWIVDYNASANIIGNGTISDATYSSAWDGSVSVAPSQNAVYDKIETLVGGSSTRTGIARTINWAAHSFTPALTEPASAYTNTWATSTDRYAQECWKFSATTTNGIRADFIFPNTYSNATPVNVRFWMKQLTAEATSTNAFSISVGSQGSGDTGGALLGTAVNVLVTGANNTNQLTRSSWSSAITVGNTAAAGDKGTIAIRRHPGNADDNGSVEVVITDIELEYLEHNVEPSNN